MAKLNAIDLFAGAGGLSEGFLEQGQFNFLAHVEWEKPMVDTLRNNLVKRWNYTEEHAKKAVVLFDVQKTDELLKGNWSEETKQAFLRNIPRAYQGLLCLFQRMLLRLELCQGLKPR